MDGSLCSYFPSIVGSIRKITFEDEEMENIVTAKEILKLAKRFDTSSVSIDDILHCFSVINTQLVSQHPLIRFLITISYDDGLTDFS